MKIKDCLLDLLERYSFHSIAWMFWGLLFITCFSYHLYFFIDKNNLYGPTILWHLIFLGPILYFPIIVAFELLIYSLLLKKEKLNSDFRIKNNRLATNPIYKIFILISNILGWITILLIIAFAIIVLYNNVDNILLPVFIIITCPILITMGLIYFIVSKKFLS